MLSRNTIHCGDCLQLMPQIETGTIDMILCDLPYGTTNCTWDTVIPFDKLWMQYERIVKPNGAIVLFGQEPFSSLLRLSNLKLYKLDIYWKKEKPTNFFQLKRRFGKCVECISIFYKEQPTFNPIMTKHRGALVTNNPKAKSKSVVAGVNNKVIPKYNDNGTRYPNDVIEIRRDKLGTTEHPTQKPVPIMEYMIRTYTNEGELVLDNCAGSGTTAEAAIRAKRDYILIEKDAEYFKGITRRIKNATAQTSLF